MNIILFIEISKNKKYTYIFPMKKNSYKYVIYRERYEE